MGSRKVKSVVFGGEKKREARSRYEEVEVEAEDVRLEEAETKRAKM